MDRKYFYDMIFIVTEYIRIRKQIINEFGNKLKFLSPRKEINYNYTQKKLLFNYHYIVRNKNNLKNYILNMIILSNVLIKLLLLQMDLYLSLYIIKEYFIIK